MVINLAMKAEEREKTNGWVDDSKRTDREREENERHKKEKEIPTEPVERVTRPREEA